MSLVVSLRTADGLILATDSLSSVQATVNIASDVKVKCPQCAKDIELRELRMPPVSFATSTRSFAQKLFPFSRKYGVASFGLSIVNEKTISYQIMELESGAEHQEFGSVDKVAEKLKNHFDKEIKKQIKDLARAPDNFYPLGFQVVGYDSAGLGRTLELRIGKKSKLVAYDNIGCTISGDTGVVVQLWELGKKIPAQHTNYRSMSLQDAIDYAEFLINTTATYQRFANMLPTVGGEVDIALITPFREFTWIKNKRLTRILMREEGGHNEQEDHS